jgi:hypothetical protein
MSDIPVNLVFEDVLSEAVLHKLLRSSGRNYRIGVSYSGHGCSWIRNKITGLNKAAKGMPYLVLTDLDKAQCAPSVVREWIADRKHANLLLRVAVREVEAWLLACRREFAEFLGIAEIRIPTDVDSIENPKELVVSLARRSRRKNLRTDIVPAVGSTARVGPDYNGRLIEFVEECWQPEVAQERSDSLRRARTALAEFSPVY